VFDKYGKIQGIDINCNGFAFIQFDTPEEAQKAVDAEQNTEIQGKIIGTSVTAKPLEQKRKITIETISFCFFIFQK
jgi:RNA recognition motif-containing protein